MYFGVLASMNVSSDALSQQLLVFIIVTFIALAITWIAINENFFRLPKEESPSRGLLSWQSVFLAFGLFLLIELVAVPSLYLLWLSWKGGQLVSAEKIHLSPEVQVWLNMFAIFCTAIALTFYYRSFDLLVRNEIWGKAQKLTYNWLTGAVSWFIIYPWIIAISQLIGIVLLYTFKTSHVDQVAVKHVKEAMSNPLQLWVMIFTVVIIVPILEEILFRGFLQTWLKGLLGRIKAIVVVSLVFALFHFSTTQGSENIELLSALFLLSCFLGFIKERQQSLWASIGLHSTFNLISVSIILIGVPGG